MIASCFSTPRDLLEKLERESARLEQEVNGDNLFNFVTTAWHLGADWLRRGPAKLSPAMEADRLLLVNNPLLQICRDINNASKHFSLNYNPLTTDVIHRPPAILGEMILGLSLLGDARGSYILVAGGQEYDLDEWRAGVVQLYESFFQKYGL